MVLLRLRGVEDRHHCVAYEHIQRALLGQDCPCRQRQVPVQHLDLELWQNLLTKGGKAPDVGVETGDLLLHPSQADAFGVREQPLDHGRSNVALECLPDAAYTSLQSPPLRQVIYHDSDASGHAATILERGEVHTQPDWSTGG